jgi:hypothetical protein
MTTTKNIRGECQHCGGQFDFPAEQAGLTADCPHCSQPTELLLAPPPEETAPAISKKPIVFIALAVVIGVVGIIGAQLAIKRAKRMVGAPESEPAAASAPVKPLGPFAGQHFEISETRFESAPGSKVVYARGTVTNTAAQQRFGVKVELELLDASGQRVGGASDYASVVEPNGTWNFRAMVMEPRAASARISAIKETK